MEQTLTALGRVGLIQRPTYDPSTGAASGTVTSVKMALVQLASVADLEGSFKSQRYAAIISKTLLEAAGWTNGRPQKGDLVVAEGQSLYVEHVGERGYADNLFYYCQCVG